MSQCCEDKSCEVVALKDKHAKVLKTVLAINAVMFLVEAYAGYVSRSTALLGDSLDMLGDALAYGASLYVLGKGIRMNALSAGLKGVIMAVLGLSVLSEAVVKILNPTIPVAQTMGAIGMLALVANLICLALLWKSRSDDLNMRSVWLCSRNDIFANVGVLGAALGVNMFHAIWPDVIIGTIIAVLFLRGSIGVLRQAIPLLRQAVA